MPGFNDLQNGIVNDVIYIWQAASLPIISYNRSQTKLKGLVAKFEGTKSSEKGAKGVPEIDWTRPLILRKFKCEIPENPKILYGRVLRAAAVSWNTEFHKRQHF